MRPSEIENAKFFVEYLNKNTKSNFYIDETFEGEDSPVDVQIKDTNERVLKIQNVAYQDGILNKIGESNVPDSKSRFMLGLAMTDEERTASILLKSIEKKKNKYPEEVRKDIILLVEVTIPAITPADIKRLPTDIDFGFKGVYFIRLPYTMAAEDDRYGREGYVYALQPVTFE